MRTLLKILCVLWLVIGALALVFGLLALVLAKLSPVQPPPSLNEGPALAWFLGSLSTGFGSVLVLLGLVTLAGIRASRGLDADSKREWAREHKRLW